MTSTLRSRILGLFSISFNHRGKAHFVVGKLFLTFIPKVGRYSVQEILWVYKEFVAMESNVPSNFFGVKLLFCKTFRGLHRFLYRPDANQQLSDRTCILYRKWCLLWSFLMGQSPNEQLVPLGGCNDTVQKANDNHQPFRDVGSWYKSSSQNPKVVQSLFDHQIPSPEWDAHGKKR